MKTVAVMGAKGGTGKTETALHLCCELAKRGFRVLAVDADMQTTFTLRAGFRPEHVGETLFDVLKYGKYAPRSAVKHTKFGFDLIPGSEKYTEQYLSIREKNQGKMLRDVLSAYKKDYDFCIIDTAPYMAGIVNENVLYAAQTVVATADMSLFGIKSLELLNDFVDKVRKAGNPDLTIVGVLVTMYDADIPVSDALVTFMEQQAQKMRVEPFETKIRMDKDFLLNTRCMREFLFNIETGAEKAEDYKAFVTELRSRV